MVNELGVEFLKTESVHRVGMGSQGPRKLKVQT